MNTQQPIEAYRNATAFLARPTCPPSTSMWMQGGHCIQGSNTGLGESWTVPTIRRNLVNEAESHVDVGCRFAGTSPDELMYIAPTWSTPYYYRASMLFLAYPETTEEPTEEDWKLFLFIDRTELNSSQETETRLTTWISYYSEAVEIPGSYASWYQDTPYWPENTQRSGTDSNYHDRITGMPLCGIILRNNGTTGTGRHFMEIDAVDRGRSYTWPRDLRPVWIGT